MHAQMETKKGELKKGTQMNKYIHAHMHQHTHPHANMHARKKNIHTLKIQKKKKLSLIF